MSAQHQTFFPAPKIFLPNYQLGLMTLGALHKKKKIKPSHILEQVLQVQTAGTQPK